LKNGYDFKKNGKEIALFRGKRQEPRYSVWREVKALIAL
jgi:hypothetical protein